MQARTKRQREVFEYIREFIENRGYEPSYSQIARALGVSSKGAVAKHIVALERQGLIFRNRENGSFKLELFPQSSISDLVSQIQWLEIPKKTILDRREEEPLFIPNILLGNLPSKKVRAFRVSNDSMLKEHILIGDIALVEERAFARDRDCVVALIEGKKTVLMNFYRLGAEVELRPANEDFESIMLPADRVEILAVFRGLLRPIS